LFKVSLINSEKISRQCAEARHKCELETTNQKVRLKNHQNAQFTMEGD